MAKVSVEGLAGISQALRRFPKQALEASAQGQLQAQIEVMALARSRTPVDEGWLKASGHVEDPEYSTKSVVVGAGFGGRAGPKGDPEPYTIRQHEDLSLNHPNGGQAKFFESAIKDREKQTLAIIADFVKHFMKTKTVKRAERRGIPKTPTEEKI